MIRKFLPFLLLISTTVYGAAAIFSGNYVQTLEQNINMNNVVSINSGSVNPSSVATTGNEGSLYLSTGGSTYIKTDSGSTTNWSYLGPFNSSNLLAITQGGTGSTTKNFVDLTTNQTAAGVKNFSSPPVFSSFATAGVLLNAAGGTVSSTAGALPIANGGTGQTTANPAFNGLSPLTTKGDSLFYSTVNARLAVPGDNGRMIPDSSTATGWRAATYINLQNGRPGKNYIQYADFNNGATTGWTLGHVPTITNGLPASNSPTFGSGASGNLSISAITSSQLAGIGSLGYVSSAATTVGDMVASSAYAVDAEDETQVMTVRFYYINHSGTIAAPGTSSNSFAWAVWDATNSVWLSSSGNFCITQTTIAGYCTGTVQMGATTASVRLVVYNATATSGAATMYFDDFYLGPQTAPLGSAMTDWNSNLTFTPNNFGTITGSTLTSKRIGDTLFVQGTFISGTLTSGIASISIPSGYSIDYTKISNSASGSQVGFGTSTSSSGNVFSNDGYVLFVDGSTTGSIYFAQSNSSATVLTKNETVSISGASNSIFTLQFQIPIVGWSSNTSMSSDTDTRVVAASAYLNTNTTATTAIPFNVALYDTHGGFNLSTGVYTIPVTGYYRVYGWATPTASNPNISIYKNGSIYNSCGVGNSSGAQGVYGCGVQANVGDTVSVGTASSLTWIGGSIASQSDSNMTIERLSGPAVVAASESVSAHYHASASTITSSLALVTFSTKDTDTHNAYASGLYTCPTTGHYAATGCIYMTAATTAATNTGEIAIYLAGAIYTANMGFPFIGTTEKPVTWCVHDDSIYCLAGQTISIEAANSGTTPSITASNNFNYFSVTRTGN